MRVLGLDPGSRRTGAGVVDRDGNRYRCEHHGVLTARARDPLHERLRAIADAAGELMDRFQPDCVVVEEAFYHESVRSTLVLGHVRGALLLTAAQRGLAIAEYTPREIKMSVTGNGGATKEQVAWMVQRLAGVKGTLASDASDAIAVALCHLHRARRPGEARAARAAATELAQLLQRRRSASSERQALERLVAERARPSGTPSAAARRAARRRAG